MAHRDLRLEEQAAAHWDGSKYLALDIWRQPELHEAGVFRSDHKDEARTYCTGDLGRLLPDGCLFIWDGRIFS